MNYNDYTTKIPTTRLPEDMPLGSAFVPYQMWQEPIPIQEGFHDGTIFSELNLPFLAYGGADYER